MAVLNKAVSGNVDYYDLFTAGAVKFFAERTLQPVIGNGTIQSGAIKLVGGFMARKFLGRGLVGDGLSLGLAIDGVEDILFNVMGGIGNNNTGDGF